MKVVIEVEEGLSEECIIIRCQRLDENIIKLQNLLAEQTKGGRDILLYKGDKSYYIPLDELLYFETENKQIWAHTAKEMFSEVEK